MSVDCSTWVWRSSRSEGTDRLVLLAIADQAGSDGLDAWPSIATIAQRCRVSTRTVQRSIAALVELGELEVGMQAGGPDRIRRDRRPNLYALPLVAGCHLDVPSSGDDGTAEPRDDGVTEQSRGDAHDVPRRPDGVTPMTGRGDTRDADGVTPVTERGDTVVTQTVHEPSIEPSAEPSIAPTPSDAGKRQRRRDVLAETVAQVCGIDLGRMTRSARGGFNRALKDLRDAGADPPAVEIAARIYRHRWRVPLTPPALAKHWPQLTVDALRADVSEPTLPRMAGAIARAEARAEARAAAR